MLDETLEKVTTDGGPMQELVETLAVLREEDGVVCWNDAAGG